METQLAIKWSRIKFFHSTNYCSWKLVYPCFRYIYSPTYPYALQNLFSTTTLFPVTRSINVLRSEAPRIQLTKQALGYKGPHIWKNIPNFFKFCNENDEVLHSFNDFKSHIISFLLSIGIAESKRVVDEILNSII